MLRLRSHLASIDFSSQRTFRRGMRFGVKRSKSETQQDATALEQLCLMCNNTFQDGGGDLSLADVQRVEALLSLVPLHEVGLEERAAEVLEGGDKRGFLQRIGLGSSRPPVLHYMHICENSKFSLGIFCLPAGVSLPLHDHPKMTVFSRVMYGEVEVTGFDWLPQSGPSKEYGQPKPAKLAVERALTGRDGQVVLRPDSGGNIHQFRTDTACAIMDLLAPPYDMDDPERSCTYYEEAGERQPDGTVMLEKGRDPTGEAFVIQPRRYQGVQIE